MGGADGPPDEEALVLETAVELSPALLATGVLCGEGELVRDLVVGLAVTTGWRQKR